ncbi:hypothetical protein KC347_g152 [Hortaea werneckii]|nr:hypothetical protein KC347_g152 [Hortaea werneckii]
MGLGSQLRHCCSTEYLLAPSISNFGRLKLQKTACDKVPHRQEFNTTEKPMVITGLTIWILASGQTVAEQTCPMWTEQVFNKKLGRWRGGVANPTYCMGPSLAAAAKTS